MMNPYKQSGLDIETTQVEVIGTILEELRRQGIIKSTMEMDIERKALMAALKPGEPVMQADVQSGLVRSQAFNQAIEMTDRDLQTVFSHLLKIDAALNQHQRLNQSISQSIKIAIRKLKDDLAHVEERVTRGLGEGALFESFRDPTSFEPELRYYTERDGSKLPEANRADLDLDQEGIKLPQIYWENALVSSTGLKKARIEITRQFGGGLMRLSNPQTGVDKAIDTSGDTFWSETVMVDEPIQISYETIQHGAACELKLTFDSVVTVNELSFTPFAEYPVDIVGAWSSTTDDGGDEEVLSLGADAIRIMDTVVIQVPDTPVKMLRILMNQIHYTKVDLMISTQEERKSEQILSAVAPEDPDDIDGGNAVFVPVAQGRYEQEPALARMLGALAKQDKIDVESLLAMQKDNQVIPVSKYAYSYGMFDIGIKRREYANLGVYVSRVHDVDRSVRGVRLDTTELHPDGSATPVEYEVSAGDSWYPILPTGTTEILGEYLRFDGSDADLRFTATTVSEVRREGLPLVLDTDYEVNDSTITILTDFDTSATYTADYVPASGSDFIDFHDKALVDGILLPSWDMYRQQGTDGRGRLTLPVAPYLNQVALNALEDPTDVGEASGLVVTITDLLGDTITAVNMTDYLGTGALRMDPESVDLQFQMEQPRKMRFNRPISREHLVTVEYPLIIRGVRLKAILRRTTNRSGATPVIKDYTLHLVR